MKFERIIKKGTSREWPTKLKMGLFRAGKGKPSLALLCRPLFRQCWWPPIFLFYVYIPYLLKFWFSVERDVISVSYLGFLKMPERKVK